MRSGDVTRRVWGAERLELATSWDPTNPIPVLVLAGYQELGGFWSNELDLLDRWSREHGPADVIDLQRLRKRERLFKVYRDRQELARAFQVSHEMTARMGGAEAAPAWMSLEHARLLLQADSLSEAASAARRARYRAAHSSFDTLTAAQAELLLGVLAVRSLEYEAADRHLQAALEFAASYPPLTGLASWLAVPWDLWTEGERLEYDGVSNRAVLVERFWRSNDPILATPDIEENRIEYRRRVGEAWFLVSGVDPALPGPLSDAGQVILRFGLPDSWSSIGGQPLHGVGPTRLDYSIHRRWNFLYRFPVANTIVPMNVVFQDRGTASSFTAVDSLRGPRWPAHLFHYGFGGLGYRLNRAIARLRQPDGKIRLLLICDTTLPEYSVRFPLQGLRFNGTAEILTALYSYQDPNRTAREQVWSRLEDETELRQTWSFRRRAGTTVFSDQAPGRIRLASRLVLRDVEGEIVGYGVDNGEVGRLHPFQRDALDASDLVLLNSLGDSLPDDRDRILAPGLVVHGPELLSSRFVPRASRQFLPGEDFAFYLELYNIDTRQGVTEVEMVTALERLRPDGTSDYTVTVRGLSQTLIRYGINQWNVARSLGLGSLQPGRYRLRVAFFDRKASRRVERLAEFQVAEPEEIAAFYEWENLPAPRGRR